MTMNAMGIYLKTNFYIGQCSDGTWNVQFLGDGTQDWFPTVQQALDWCLSWRSEDG
jgi:hypothetical protein